MFEIVDDDDDDNNDDNDNGRGPWVSYNLTSEHLAQVS